MKLWCYLQVQFRPPAPADDLFYNWICSLDIQPFCILNRPAGYRINSEDEMSGVLSIGMLVMSENCKSYPHNTLTHDICLDRRSFIFGNPVLNFETVKERHTAIVMKKGYLHAQVEKYGAFPRCCFRVEHGTSDKTL